MVKNNMAKHIKAGKKASSGKHAASSSAPKKEDILSTEVIEESSSVEQEAEETIDFEETIEPDGIESDDVELDDAESGEMIAGVVPVGVPEKVKKKISPKKVGIVLGSIAAVLLVAYVIVAIVFMGRFWPNTVIGSTDISLMTADEGGALLSEKTENYELNVKGQGLSFSVSAQEAELSLDGAAILSKALESHNSWAWPVEIFRSHDERDSMEANYSETGFEAIVRKQVVEFNERAQAPKNANVVYSEKEKAFVITPEEAGTLLDENAVMKKVDQAIMYLDPLVRITEDELVHPMVISTDASLSTARDAANKMIKADLKLMMEGNLIAEVGPQQISEWVILGAEMSIQFDDAAMLAWVNSVAESCNTVGSTRTYTRPDGKVITVTGGTYGWQIDNGALISMVEDGVTKGQVATLEIPVLASGTGFVNLGGQDWGSRYCDIDLAEQYARFYDEAGTLIWESAIITGRPDGKHDTPQGVYVLNSKASPSTLIGEKDPKTGKPEYETRVEYWMPFVGNAIGLHDASWQPDFGGSMYRNGYGSHGCINLPPAKAQELYGIIQAGDVVVSHW